MSSPFPPRSAATAGYEGRRAFMFYTNWIDDTRDSLTPEQQLEFIAILVNYGCYGTPPPPGTTPVVASMFGLIRNVLDADLRKYEAAAARHRAAADRRAAERAEAASRTATAPTKARTAQLHHTDAVAIPLHDISNTHNTELNTQNTEPTTQNTELTTQNSSSLPEEAERNEENEGKRKKEEGSGGVVNPAGAAAGGAVSGTFGAAGGAVGGSFQPPATLDQMRAYWSLRGMTSSVEEFWAFYAQAGWCTRRGERLTNWKMAAINWEDRYRTHIAPARRREALAAATLRRETLAGEAAVERERQRQEREAEVAEREAHAVSPALGRHMYARAVELCGGDDDAAFDLLRRSTAERDIFDRLAEGFEG